MEEESPLRSSPGQPGTTHHDPNHERAIESSCPHRTPECRTAGSRTGTKAASAVRLRGPRRGVSASRRAALRGQILNLSLTGCYIETALVNLERGTQVEVYFVTNRLQFRVLGNIAALRRKCGVGIAFLNVSPRRALQIAELVKELAENSVEN
jgi:hypothetical protein